MERIGSLINKLKEQFEQGASPAQMLVTIQMLQTEFSHLKVSGQTLGTSKVAVVLPRSVNIPDQAEYEMSSLPRVEKQTEVSEEKANYSSRSSRKNEQSNLLFDPLVEIPTLSHQREVNEINGDNESLNDRLKENKTEVAEILKHEPIKDLRKAIGINDRFVFINDLFRGDEAMYERSIKTINSFNIFPEAEYWINRELIVKLGWDVNNEIVKHFYQLVKRRFS